MLHYVHPLLYENGSLHQQMLKSCLILCHNMICILIFAARYNTHYNITKVHEPCYDFFFFAQQDHNGLDLTVQILCHIPIPCQLEKTEIYRLQQEHHWICQLVTMEPLGQNDMGKQAYLGYIVYSVLPFTAPIHRLEYTNSITMHTPLIK